MKHEWETKNSVSGCHLLSDKKLYAFGKNIRKMKKNFTQWDSGYGSVIQAWLS